MAREIREELGVEVRDIRYLGALENTFQYNGRSGHEIVLVYDGAFADGSLYEREDLTGYEGEEREPFRAVWVRLSELGANAPPLYPDGLLDLLSAVPGVWRSHVVART